MLVSSNGSKLYVSFKKNAKISSSWLTQRIWGLRKLMLRTSSWNLKCKKRSKRFIFLARIRLLKDWVLLTRMAETTFSKGMSKALIWLTLFKKLETWKTKAPKLTMAHQPLPLEFKCRRPSSLIKTNGLKKFVKLMKGVSNTIKCLGHSK